MAVPKIIQIPEGDEGALQYHYRRIEVSSAEILTLFSAPKELVEAPGVGYILMPINAVAFMHFGTIAYDNTNDDPEIKTATGTKNMGFTNILSEVADKIMFQPLGLATGAQVENEALILTEDVDPTLGDGTLTIYLWYIKLEL